MTPKFVVLLQFIQLFFVVCITKYTYIYFCMTIYAFLMNSLQLPKTQPKTDTKKVIHNKKTLHKKHTLLYNNNKYIPTKKKNKLEEFTMRRTKEEIQAAKLAEEKRQYKIIESLKEILEKGGHKVFTSLNHVSQSGMTRAISAYVATEKGEITCIDWYIEQLGLFSRDTKHGGLKVGGCGMDMGFHLVYTLSMTVYCQKKYDHDSAYKLQQSWL